jgi:hypothetical protein
MRVSTILRLAGVALLACPAVALAAEKVPDVKGKWAGKSYSIIAGMGGHWPTNNGTFDKPMTSEKDVVIDITGQVDRHIWGITTLSGGGEKTDEPFIGELTGKGSREVLMVDSDGTLKGELRGDVMSYCYTQVGGKTNASVISCTDVKRTR